MMHILTRAIFTWLLFIPLAMFLDRRTLFNFLIGFSLCTAVAVLVGYAPGILAAVKRGTGLRGAHYLVLGIACTWFGIIVYGSMIWIWRNTGQSDVKIINHWITAFAIFMTTTGGLLYLAAFDAVRETLATRYWIRVGLLLALAIAIAYGILTATLQESDILRWLINTEFEPFPW